jgi:hypothetical protein
MADRQLRNRIVGPDAEVSGNADIETQLECGQIEVFDNTVDSPTVEAVRGEKGNTGVIKSGGRETGTDPQPSTECPANQGTERLDTLRDFIANAFRSLQDSQTKLNENQTKLQEKIESNNAKLSAEIQAVKDSIRQDSERLAAKFEMGKKIKQGNNRKN